MNAPSGSQKAAEAKAPAAALPTAPPWWRTLRADGPAHVRFALGASFIALLLLLWWVLTRGAATEAIISPSKLPSPGKVFGSFGAVMERDLIGAIIATLSRVFFGVALAALIGIGLGVIAASFRAVGAAMMPLVIFLRSVPMGALLPLTLLWFSIGEEQKRMFIFLAVVPFVFSDTVQAISSVPERYVETAQTLGASRLQIVVKVLLRLALPDIVTSLRFQVGLALGYVTLAEAINTETGIGALINTSDRLGYQEHKYLILFIIALLAFGIDACIRVFQRQLFYYRKDL
ncbi:MAG: ABC transporter permease subunit [Myxococcales bacterium]|nr:ABC transporter permease subunit [Myxococcales bacterium]